MVSALVAIALSLMPNDGARTKMDARTPERVLVAVLTSPRDGDVVWHESEAVFLDDAVMVPVRVDDSFVSLGNTPIHLRVGFSGRAVETVQTRF